MKFEYGDPVLILTHDERILEAKYLRTEKDYGQVLFAGENIQFHLLACIYPNSAYIKAFLEDWAATRKTEKKKYDDMMSAIYDLRNRINRGEVK